MKTIYSDNTIFELSQKYPELVYLLEEAGFKDIVKPGMLKTAGRFMTLEKGAALRNIDFFQVQSLLKAKGFEYVTKEQREYKEKEVHERRKTVLKDIIMKLHQGHSVDEVKDLFDSEFKNVSAMEISNVERTLLEEGIKVEEIQSLCDVHAAVFKGSIEEIHSQDGDEFNPGHPIYVLKKENNVIKHIIQSMINPFLNDKKASVKSLALGIEQLLSIDIHYSKKENLFFPFMEKYDITAPPKVMWGVDDEIRAELKDIKQKLSKTDTLDITFITEIKASLEKVLEMIYKEENIMLPMLLENLTKEEWKVIADESYEIGFLYDDVPKWDVDFGKDGNKEETFSPALDKEGELKLTSGSFNGEELENLLNSLPLDITFVDKNDRVKYFSQSSERIFPRTLTVIGREVANCHPPASVHIVESIIDDFKSGKKDSESFWIKLGDKYVYIRYFAVRNNEGKYLGVVEVSQDIKPIKAIEGEKRLMD